MVEENKNPSETTSEESSGVDYIEALKKMKENSVSKEQYAKLQEENKKLLQSLINGEEIEAPRQEGYEVSDEEFKKLVSEVAPRDSLVDLSNLAVAEKTLKIRKAILERGGNDIFTPKTRDGKVSDDAIDSAESVAAALQSAIEYAEGDSELFTNELQRMMTDAGPLQRSKGRK